MPTKMKELGIDRMTIEDRFNLAHEILDSISSEENLDAPSQEFLEELRRRIEEMDANPGKGIPWEQMKAAALAQAKK